MLILKKINNNVALASTDAGEEVVVFGKGVGFHEMPYELEDESVIQRVFRDVDEKSIDGFGHRKSPVPRGRLRVSARDRAWPSRH